MRKIYLTLIAFLLFTAGAVHGQGFYYLKGYNDQLNAYPPQGTTPKILISKQTKDTLTAWQALPFAFNFYGKTVNGYYASDNGYITFDQSATKSLNANTTLPSASAPNEAIFAFWDDLDLNFTSGTTNASITNYTVGASGSRRHVIRWELAAPKGKGSADNFMWFAIVLYEKGGFDIVYKFAKLAAATSGTAGAQLNDTTGIIIDNNPNMSFPAVANSNATDDIVYSFFEGNQPAIDITMISHNVPNTVATSANTLISGVLKNYGSQAITSLTLNYSIDGGAAVADNKSGLNIAANGGSYNFSHATPWKGATPGQTYSIKVWASNLNGNADENPANDTLTFSVFVNNGTSAPKNVLIEEGSGAWCIHCPDGHVRLKEILAGSPNVIGVVHHNDYNGSPIYDQMTNPQSTIVNNTFALGYPYGVVDRTLFSDQSTVGLNRGLWASKAFERLNANTPVKVTISDKSYNPDTRQIKFTVKAEFVDFAQGEMRIGAMIVEDNVRGVGSGWDQKIATTYTSDPNHPFYGYPTNLVGYPHNHVVINIPSGAFGNSGIISNTVTPGQSFTKEYTYTLPAATTVEIPETSKFEPKGTVTGRNKPYDIQLVGFVAYYNTDVKNRQVLNSVETSLGVTNGIAEEVKAEAGNVSLYPNPTNGISSVVFELPKASNASVEIYNALGQKIQTVKEGNFVAGQHTVFFDASQFENGIYFLNVTTNEGRTAKRFVVVK